jgi:hypothetical protein
MLFGFMPLVYEDSIMVKPILGSNNQLPNFLSCSVLKHSAHVRFSFLPFLSACCTLLPPRLVSTKGQIRLDSCPSDVLSKGQKSALNLLESELELVESIAL